MSKITLLNLNEINLYLCEKYNINFITENNLKKRFLNNKHFKNDLEIKIILEIDKYFTENNFYSTKFFWCIKSKLENKEIDLIKVFNKSFLNNLLFIINNDKYLKKFYSNVIINK